MAGFLQRAKNATKNAAKQTVANAGANALSSAINQGTAALGLETNIQVKAPDVTSGPSGGYDPDTYYRVDVAHGFSRPMDHGLPGDEIAFLQYPQAPATLPPGAADYARAWWQPWGGLLEGHIDIARALEAGDAAGAQQLLYRWEQGISQARTAAHQLGDFNGARTLSVAVDDVNEHFENVADALREYMNCRSLGQDPSGAVESAQACIVNMHVALNRPVAAFFADPSGAATAQAEAEAYAGMPGMGGMAGMPGMPGMMPGAGADTSGPEFAPVQGVSFHDYVAGSQRIQEGVSADVVAKVLGVERPMWDAAANEWLTRMTQTHPMSVGMQYTPLSQTPHPRLTPEACAAAGGGPSALPGGVDNSGRLRTDMDFYIEAAAAGQAAAEAGIDAGGYLESNYGVTVMQVSNAGVAWMSNPANISRITTLQQAKAKEIFTSITGYSNDVAPGALPDGVEDIAADIEF